MTSGLKILNVVGARPNLPKIAPLLREMRRHPETTAILVHTGQHHDENLSEHFLSANEDSGASQLGGWLGLTCSPDGGNPEAHRAGPGGTQARCSGCSRGREFNDCGFPGSRQARYSRGHLEAGLRSFDRTMPEEINRVLTDAIADYLFVTEEDAITNLLKEGRTRDSIFLVGNVMIDSLRHFLPLAQQSPVGNWA